MEFVYPQFFWGMIIPFIIFVFLVTTNRDKISRIFDKEILERLRADSDAMPNSVRNFILFLAVFLMIVALSRPVIPKGEKVINLKGVSAVVALDISGSMRSEDIYPNRLEFAKKKIAELLDAMPNDEIALSAFASGAFVLAPFTSDKATLKQLIEGVNDSYINMASTDFSTIVDLASKLLKKRKEKILIVFSDGGDKRDLKKLENELKQNGITMYAVLIGTKEGAPVLNDRHKVVHLKNGSIAMTQINEDFGRVAKATGGDYIIASYGKSDMVKLANEIHSKFNSKAKGQIHIKERIELFYYLLIGAVILLIIGFSSIPKLKRES